VVLALVSPDEIFAREKTRLQDGAEMILLRPKETQESGQNYDY